MIIRRIDTMGRVSIPAHARRVLGWECGQEVEIKTDRGRVVLQLYVAGCIFCGTTEGQLYEEAGILTCAKCARRIAAAHNGEPDTLRGREKWQIG